METPDTGAGEVPERLLESFIAATQAALGEMAGTEVRVKAVSRQPLDRAAGDVTAVVELASATAQTLVLAFPEPTAAALAGRILAGVAEGIDADLVRDCVGEIANVVAGQAKAMLAGTPYRFTFSLPRVVAGTTPEPRPDPGADCLVIAFEGDLGEFAVQLLLRR